MHRVRLPGYAARRKAGERRNHMTADEYQYRLNVAIVYSLAVLAYDTTWTVLLEVLM